MRALHSLLALATAAFAFAPLAAIADQADGRYDLPDHSLAASDAAGKKLFDRDGSVMVVKPQFMEKAQPTVEAPPNELPQWPAKWAPPDDEY